MVLQATVLVMTNCKFCGHVHIYNICVHVYFLVIAVVSLPLVAIFMFFTFMPITPLIGNFVTVWYVSETKCFEVCVY